MKKILFFAVGIVLIGAGCQSTSSIQIQEPPATIQDMGKQIDAQVRVDAQDDLENNAAVASGGLLTLYGDVTGDGVDEALVEIPSGGTAGSEAVLVYSLNASKQVQLLKRINGFRLSSRAQGGKLEVISSDPESGGNVVQLDTYVWAGSDFKLESSVEKNINTDCYSDMWQAHQCTI